MRKSVKVILVITVLLALLIPTTVTASSHKKSSQQKTSSHKKCYPQHNQGKLKLLLKQANDFDPVNAVNDGIYIASVTDKYFKGGVEVGLQKLLEAGQVYVNGLRIPAKPATYYMNGMPAIWQKGDGHWTWQAHDKLNTDKDELHNGDYSFNFARRRFVIAASSLRGMTTSIWAQKGKTTACRVDFLIKSGGQVEKILVNRNGTTTVWGVPIDATSYNTDGGPNDRESRTLPTCNFDRKIKPGDTVLYWRGPDGWHMERAIPVFGLMTAPNTMNITVDGVTASDALIVRYNMQRGSRPGQFISATNNLKLGDIPVTLFNTDTGHVVGISRMGYARTGVHAALHYVDEQLAGKTIVASANGEDVWADTYWVTQAILDTYNAAYDAAKAAFLNPEATNSQLDAATEALGAAFGAPGKGLNSMQKGKKEKITIKTFFTDGTTKITDAAYNQYFGGDALAGVEALLDQGKVSVNGIRVPAAETDTTLYKVNGIDSLWWNTTLTPNTWGYAVHKYVWNYGAPGLGGVSYSPLPWTFREARLQFVQDLSRRFGRMITLTIDAAAEKAVSVDMTETESLVVASIDVHGATTYIKRSAFTLETGRYPVRFDVNAMGPDGMGFPTENVDPALRVGDFAVWWQGPDGWHLKRAVPVTGLLLLVSKGVYSIDGVTQPTEADCSRFNLNSANRPTQFYTANTRLGLGGIPATAWCVPETGNPIGFTRGSDANAKAALALAVTNANAAKAGVLVSAAGDGSDVSAAPGTKWVTAAAMDAYNAALAAAEAVSGNTASGAIACDTAIYDLSLALGQSATPGPASGFLGAVKVK